MKLTELFENFYLLFEAREDFVANQYNDKLTTAARDDSSYKGDDTPLAVVQAIAKADPTNGKHTQFLAKMYVAKQFKVEDIERIKSELEKFEKFKPRIAIKDINSYKSLGQLHDVLAQFDDETAASGKAKTKEIKAGAKKFMDTPNFKVIIPKTEESACLYGTGTKWCTTAEKDNKFDSYNKQGDLYIILTKIDGKDRKFQFHYESDSFMDERNQEITQKDIASLSEIPEYADFLNSQIKKHYSKYLD